MSTSRTAVYAQIVVAALVPVAILAVYSFVLMPLDLGLGLGEGYRVLGTPSFAIVAGGFWLYFVFLVSRLIARTTTRTAITPWRIVRSVIVSLCFAFATGYALVAVPMGGIVDAVAYRGIYVGSEVSGALALPFLCFASLSALICIAHLAVTIATSILARVRRQGAAG